MKVNGSIRGTIADFAWLESLEQAFDTQVIIWHIFDHWKHVFG